MYYIRAAKISHQGNRRSEAIAYSRRLHNASDVQPWRLVFTFDRNGFSLSHCLPWMSTVHGWIRKFSQSPFRSLRPWMGKSAYRKQSFFSFVYSTTFSTIIGLLQLIKQSDSFRLEESFSDEVWRFRSTLFFFFFWAVKFEIYRKQNSLFHNHLSYHSGSWSFAGKYFLTYPRLCTSEGVRIVRRNVVINLLSGEIERLQICLNCMEM